MFLTPRVFARTRLVRRSCLRRGIDGYNLAMNPAIISTLDKIESNLPSVPRRLFQLNRAVATAGCTALSSVAEAFSSATQSVSSRASTGARTVTGQAESVADRIQTTAQHGVREVVGQAKSQVAATIDTVEDETVGLLETAIATVDDSPTGSYETWTKAELYERAQEVDVDGRSAMSKAELITALRSAD